MNEPFAYPQEPHARRHHPRGYADYAGYKPWLRDEFVFRCVYCLERETWYPSRDAAFSIDHFDPQVLRPERNRDYTNLVYACTRCNSVKSAATSLLDPTAAGLGLHMRVAADGSIQALSKAGQRLIDLLHLDVNPAVEVRREYLLLLRARRERPDDPVIRQLFVQKFGFPTDLPDLQALRPPLGNANAGSEQNCFRARRARGELEETY